MKYKIGRITTPVKPDDGTYRGIASGYEVQVTFNKHTIYFMQIIGYGVRGTKPCKVKVKNGEAEVIFDR